MQLPPRSSLPCRIQPSQASMVPGLVIRRLKPFSVGTETFQTPISLVASGSILPYLAQGTSSIHHMHSLACHHLVPPALRTTHGDRRQLDRIITAHSGLGLVGCCIHDRPFQTRRITPPLVLSFIKLQSPCKPLGFSIFPTHLALFSCNTKTMPTSILSLGLQYGRSASGEPPAVDLI